MNCVFCQIISQNGHAFKIYENDHVLAFLDIYPVSDGHTLIVTKKHFTHWTVTPDHLISEISKAVKPVVKILDQKLKPSGYNFLSNQGAIASQEVMHLHIVPMVFCCILNGLVIELSLKYLALSKSSRCKSFLKS